jgi:hypothetical protein
MAGKKGNKAHANKTSYPNQKNNRKDPKIIYRKFAEIYNNVITDKGNKITSWQSACLSIGWRVTKMDYWANKTPIFGIYKKEIKEVLISFVDNKALNGDFNPTASIWRMKQLGEIDKQEIDQNVNISNIDLDYDDFTED